LVVFNRWLPIWCSCKFGWHTIGETVGFDGCSIHAKCSKCGYEGMIDSQGNLF